MQLTGYILVRSILTVVPHNPNSDFFSVENRIMATNYDDTLRFCLNGILQNKTIQVYPTEEEAQTEAFRIFKAFVQDESSLFLMPVCITFQEGCLETGTQEQPYSIEGTKIDTIEPIPMKNDAQAKIVSVIRNGNGVASSSTPLTKHTYFQL